MSRRVLFIALLILTALPQVHALSPDERRQYLAKLQTIIPTVPSFYEPWDFTRLPNATHDRIIQWMAKTMK